MSGSVFVDGALHADAEPFIAREPFPWRTYRAFVDPARFADACADFPAVELFEQHVQIARGWQRPHDRYYLAYGGDVASRPGVVGRADLPASWRVLIDAFEAAAFRTFMTTMLQRDVSLRFAWHRSYRGCEVSPHVDADEKLGTMVFYCNTAANWDAGWGGDTLLLGDLPSGVTRPDFADFQTRIAVRALETQSLLFGRTSRSWHGVEPLTCPDTHFRMTFHVIAESR